MSKRVLCCVGKHTPPSLQINLKLFQLFVWINNFGISLFASRSYFYLILFPRDFSFYCYFVFFYFDCVYHNAFHLKNYLWAMTCMFVGEFCLNIKSDSHNSIINHGVKKKYGTLDKNIKTRYLPLFFFFSCFSHILPPALFNLIHTHKDLFLFEWQCMRFIASFPNFMLTLAKQMATKHPTFPL